jgi:hypothetical protein
LTFRLRDVVPWGRSYDEYLRMFALGDAELRSTILGCADGPASFNAEATRRGARVVSCDPLYHCNADAVRARIATTFDEVLEQTRVNRDAFVWNSIGSVEELGAVRRAAMTAFLEDYAAPRSKRRYLAAALPALPFSDDAFDLALCSHFLFLYSELFGAEFHVAAVRELCRAAAEVRIFPLLSLDGHFSPWVEAVRAGLDTGFVVSLETVPYEFQRGGNQMMLIRRADRSNPSRQEIVGACHAPGDRRGYRPSKSGLAVV